MLMRGWGRVLAVLCLGGVLAGCAGPGREFDNRGGYVDAQADLWIYPAHGAGARALRAYALQAGLVQLITTAPISSAARAGTINQVINANDRLGEVLACLRIRQCFYYDTVMKEYEDSLLSLAITLFDAESRRSLLGRTATMLTSSRTTGTMLTAALMVASDAFYTGRTLGALYRDFAAMQMQFFINEPGNPGTAYGAARDAIASIYARFPTDIRAWQSQLSAAYAAGIDPIASAKNFKMVRELIRYSCMQIGVDNSVAKCVGDLDFDIVLGTTVTDCAVSLVNARTQQFPSCDQSGPDPRSAVRSMRPAPVRASTQLPPTVPASSAAGPAAAGPVTSEAAIQPVMAWAHRPEAAEWTAILSRSIASNGILPSLVPGGIDEFCPRYPQQSRAARTAFWVSLFSKIAEHESSFDTTSALQEQQNGRPWLDNGEPVISTGLLQISAPSARRGYRCSGVSDARSLTLPEVNLSCGVTIMARHIARDGRFADGHDNATARGAARYWRVLRSDPGIVGVRAQIRAFTRSLPYCA